MIKKGMLVLISVIGSLLISQHQAIKADNIHYHVGNAKRAQRVLNSLRAVKYSDQSIVMVNDEGTLVFDNNRQSYLVKKNGRMTTVDLTKQKHWAQTTLGTLKDKLKQGIQHKSSVILIEDVAKHGAKQLVHREHNYPSKKNHHSFKQWWHHFWQ